MEEEQKKREFAAYMASKKDEEMEEMTQNDETVHRLNALKASKSTSAFDAALLNLLENYNGKNFT